VIVTIAFAKAPVYGFRPYISVFAKILEKALLDIKYYQVYYFSRGKKCLLIL
jgi:hypothetical protein